MSKLSFVCDVKIVYSTRSKSSIEYSKRFFFESDFPEEFYFLARKAQGLTLLDLYERVSSTWISILGIECSSPST